MVFDQYIWLENNIATSLTFTSERAQYEKYKSLGQTIMQTFEQKNAFKKDKPIYEVAEIGNINIISTSRYELQIPTSWTLDDKNLSAEVIAISPNANQRESINVSTENLRGSGMTLDEYAELSLPALEGSIGEFKLITNEVYGNGKERRHSRVFTGVINKIPFHYHQIYYVQNDDAYILTYTCDESYFIKGKPEIEEIISSFKLK